MILAETLGVIMPFWLRFKLAFTWRNHACNAEGVVIDDTAKGLIKERQSAAQLKREESPDGPSSESEPTSVGFGSDIIP